MYKATVFIISKRKELSIKYKKLLEGLNTEVCVINSLSEAFKQIPLKEPEIIIISDTVEENLSDLCKKIRVLTFNFRPTIIAVSKSSETMDKLQTLEAGADDFLSELISSSEFAARIKAHLRHFLENSLNRTTFLVRQNLTEKAVKKALSNKNDKAVMLLEIFGLELYREIYGEIAFEKVLQTLTSILNSTLNAEDFAGHSSNNRFVLLTSIEKAEKIASFLTFAFDNVVEHFYMPSDFSNKFILYSSEEVAESKISLMKLGVAVLELNKTNFKDYKQVLNSLFGLLKSCKRAEKSSYLFDRTKISGKKQEQTKKKTILIEENDEALFYLLKTALELKKYQVERIFYDDFYLKMCKKYKPEVLILDYGFENTKEGIAICKKIKKLKGQTPKIIFSSSIQNKEEILSAGADLYLPKPYDIKVILQWVENFS